MSGLRLDRQVEELGPDPIASRRPPTGRPPAGRDTSALRIGLSCLRAASTTPTPIRCLGQQFPLGASGSEPFRAYPRVAGATSTVRRALPLPVDAHEIAVAGPPRVSWRPARGRASRPDRIAGLRVLLGDIVGQPSFGGVGRADLLQTREEFALFLESFRASAKVDTGSLLGAKRASK